RNFIRTEVSAEAFEKRKGSSAYKLKGLSLSDRSAQKLRLRRWCRLRVRIASQRRRRGLGRIRLRGRRAIRICRRRVIRSRRTTLQRRASGRVVIACGDCSRVGYARVRKTQQTILNPLKLG